MKEITSSEMSQVSGAGYLRDLTVYYSTQSGAMFGYAVGNLVPIIGGVTAAIGFAAGAAAGKIYGLVVGTILEAIFDRKKPTK